MDSFPVTDEFAPQKGSYREPTAKSETYVAGDGGGRVYVPESKSRFMIKLGLTQSGLDTLLSLYGANQLTPIEFTWVEDGLTYNVLFEDRPDVRPDENLWWEVTVKLIEA